MDHPPTHTPTPGSDFLGPYPGLFLVLIPFLCTPSWPANPWETSLLQARPTSCSHGSWQVPPAPLLTPHDSAGLNLLWLYLFPLARSADPHPLPSFCSVLPRVLQASVPHNTGLWAHTSPCILAAYTVSPDANTTAPAALTAEHLRGFP